jgi:hypothetical protein
MQVIYACIEMVESPLFARIIHSSEWRGRLSGVYVDEAHLIYETHDWRPAYARLHRLRMILGHDIPFVGLSATCPSTHREALVTHAGFHHDYKFINLGNFRPELSTVVLPIEHDFASFRDLAFILPFGSQERDLMKSIIYTDDLELLTKMFWWIFSRLSAMGLPAHLVDIIHSGLSDRHQDICIKDFRNGRTMFLLGSSKISAGMDFPDVERVIQYKVRGLTLASADQRRGRGGRRAGMRAVGIFLVEPGMLKDGGLSVESPGCEDPGMLDLVQSDDTCCDIIFARHLENPPYPHDPFRCCCNRCQPSLNPGREYQWVLVEPGSQSQSLPATCITDEQTEIIYQELVRWRTHLWKKEWRDKWPSYGPKTLVSDSDLNTVAKHAKSIHTIDDIRRRTNIIHWIDLSTSFLDALQAAVALVLEPNAFEIPVTNTEAQATTSFVDDEPARKRQKANPGRLEFGEMVLDFI